MEKLESLRLIYETHIDASLTYDERRFTLLQSYLFGVTVVFAFWFNISDKARRKALFWPLSFFTIVATFFAAYLVYVYSRDSHTYFLFAEEVIHRAYEVEAGVAAAPDNRGFFVRKWTEALEKFNDRKFYGVWSLWVFPIIMYSIALMVAASLAWKSDSSSERQLSSRADSD